MTEEWRVIPSWPWYEASSRGRIRNATTGRVLSPALAGSAKAYLGVRLWNTPGKFGRTVNVHVAVAEAFIGPRPEGLTINHKDAVKTNNAPDNLEYVTCYDNHQHAVAHGLHPRGVKHWSAKFTDAQVFWMRQTYAERQFTRRRLRELYGVSKTTIDSILSGRTWPHVGGPLAHRRHGQ